MYPKRVPKIADVKVRKEPIDRGSTAQRADGRVSWRLGEADLVGDWPWPAIEEDELRLVLRLFGAIDHKNATWASMSGKGIGKIRAIPVENVISAAQRRLTDLGKDDLDHVHEIMITNTKRVWGRRVGNTFHVLWWDPRHEVCPSHRRNS